MPLTEATLATMNQTQTTRVLPADEFHRLAAAPDGMVPNPQFVTAIVAERGTTLLGRRFLCLVPHVEGRWQLPECDIAALEAALGEHLAAMGIQGAMCAAPTSEDLSPYGYTPLPLLLWVRQVPAPAPDEAPAPTVALVS